MEKFELHINSLVEKIEIKVEINPKGIISTESIKVASLEIRRQIETALLRAVAGAEREISSKCDNGSSRSQKEPSEDNLEIHINKIVERLDIISFPCHQCNLSKEQIQNACSQLGSLVAKTLQQEIETAVNNASSIHPETNSEKH